MKWGNLKWSKRKQSQQACRKRQKCLEVFHKKASSTLNHGNRCYKEYDDGRDQERWFLTSILISDNLILLKLFINAFWRWLQSDKYLFSTDKHLDFSTSKACLFSWYVSADLLLWYWVAQVFISSSSSNDL